MSFEDSLEKIKLIDTYGKLLTDKQLKIVKDYYFDNLSLAEIGEIYNISRQAVSDSISKSIKSLQSFENILGICHNQDKITKDLTVLLDLIQEDNVKDKIKQIIEYIRS